MLTIDEALRLVVESSRPLPPRRLPLVEAAGLVLAEDISSEINSPPYDKALMDGYAVRSIDREPQRRVLEEIAAGDMPRFALTPDTTSRIMTGAPLPEGADAVIQVELTEMISDSVVQFQNGDTDPGKNVLPLGTSMRVGDAALKRGAVLRPIEIAVLAEIGRGMASVIPRPKLSILPTGNELVPPGVRPATGQISNSNGPMLVAMSKRANADAIELEIARDNRDELAQLIKLGLASDILILSGGVSAGKFDLVPQVLAELGVEQVFHKIALRPGKPLWFGVKDDGHRRTLVFGLPGNPVSSLVCFELFVRPAIEILSGHQFAGWVTSKARLTHDFEFRGDRAACLPALITDSADGHAPSVTILPWHGSADIFSLTRANALARFAGEAGSFPADTPIDVVRI